MVCQALGAGNLGTPSRAPVPTPWLDRAPQWPRLRDPARFALQWMDPGAWSAQQTALNCTCAWLFPPPPQVYPGPKAGARLLREVSGGGARGDHSGCLLAQGWRAHAHAQLCRAFGAPLNPPRPLRLRTLGDQYLSRSEIR